MAYGIKTFDEASGALQLSDTSGTYYRVLQRGTVASYGTVNHYAGGGYNHYYRIDGNWVTNEHLIFIRPAPGYFSHLMTAGLAGLEKDSRLGYSAFGIYSASTSAPVLEYCIVTRSSWSAPAGLGLLVKNGAGQTIFNSNDGFPAVVGTAMISTDISNFYSVQSFSFNPGAYTDRPYMLLKHGERVYKANDFTVWYADLLVWFSGATTVSYQLKASLSENGNAVGFPATHYHDLLIAMIV